MQLNAVVNNSDPADEDLKKTSLSERAKNFLSELGAKKIKDLADVFSPGSPTAGKYNSKTVSEIRQFVANSTHVSYDDLSSDQKAILTSKADEIDFSVRLSNVLKATDKPYIGDIISLTDDQFIKIQNCGKKTLKEFKDFLAAHNLQLGINLVGWDTAKVTAIRNACLPSNKQKNGFSLLSDIQKFILCTHVDELDLSVRLHNVLKSLKIEFVRDALTFSPGKLLAHRNCGRGSINELKNFLEKYGLSLGQPLTGGDLEEINFVRATPSFIQFQKTKQEHSSNLSLEEQFLNLATSLIGARHALTVCSFYGFDGKGRKSLQVVGDQFGITRERVRQVCAKFEKLVSRKKLHLLTAENAIKKLTEQVPCSEEELSSLSADEGFSKEKFIHDGYLSYCEIQGMTAPWFAYKFNDAHLLFPTSVSRELLDQTRAYIRKKVGKSGCGHIEELEGFLLERGLQQTLTSTIAKLIIKHDEFFWLDQDNKVFGLKDLTEDRCRPLNRIKKVFSVAGNILPSQLRSAINRDYRMSGLHLSTNDAVLVSLGYGLAKKNGNMLEALDGKRVATEDMLSSRELVIKEAFIGLGSPLHISTLRSYCLKRSIGEASFFMTLNNAAIFTRLLPGVYQLVGQHCPPGAAEDILRQHNIRAATVFKDIGRDPDGNLWLAYKLSVGAIGNGVVSLPKAAAHLLSRKSFKMALDEERSIEIKTTESQIYGFRPFFMANGADENDYFLITLKNDAVIEGKLVDEEGYEEACRT